MSNEEKFKNKLTAAFDEPHYEYDAGNWQKASDHLDAEDAKRKRRFFFWLFTGLGFGILMTGYLFLIPQDHKKQFASSENKSVTRGKYFIDSTVTRTPNTKHSLKNNKEIACKKLEKQKSIKKNKKKNDPLSSDLRSVYTSNSSAKEIKVKQIITTASLPFSGELILTKSKKKIEKNDGSSNAGKITKDGNQQANSSENLKNKETHDVLSTAETSHMNEEGKSTSVDDSRGNNEKPAKAEVTQDLFVAPKDSTLKNIPLSSKADTTGVAVIESTIPIIVPANYFYVEAGTYFNFGWKALNKREATSLNPYLGLSYFMRLTDKVGFSIGGYYTTISNLNYAKITKATKIVFGEESEVTAITPSRLNYLSVPLKVQYAIDPKQIITVGYSVGYLLDAQSKVEKYTERLDAKENVTSYRTGGYTEGFKTFNSQISVGYRRLLYKKLFVNAEFFYGLTDLRDNSFFGLKVNERTSGIKLSLSYDLIKK